VRKLLLNIVGIAAIGALGFALLLDLGSVTFAGLFTADSYYLPLAQVVPEANVAQMEDMVIDIHTGIMKRQGMLFGAIHVTALAAVVLLLVSFNHSEDSVSRDPAD
jgi:hypothetical protein